MHSSLQRVSRIIRCHRPVCKRYILSAAYKCEEAIGSRHDEDPLINLDAGTFFSDAQKQVVAEGIVTGPTLDMAASIITDQNEFQIVRLLLYKLRHSRECYRLLNSTQRSLVHHAIKLKQEDSLMQMIEDPINFGLFPDEFSTNILMDHFLETTQYEYAARMAVYVMRQEMFENPLTCILAVECCLRWLSLGKEKTWEEMHIPESVPEQSKTLSEGEDEIYFKMPYVKNHTFDDHFDLADSVKLVGKSLAWSARNVPDTAISANAQLLGYLLYENEEHTENLVERVKTELLFKDFMEFMPSGSEVDSKEENAAKKEESEAVEAEEDWKTDVVEKLKSFGVSESCFLETVHKQVLKTVETVSMEDIQNQMNNFKLWNLEILRQIRLKKDLDEKEEFLKNLQKEVADIRLEEEYLTFFDKRDEWEQSIPQQLLDQKVSKTIDYKKLSDEEYAKVIPDPKQFLRKQGRK